MKERGYSWTCSARFDTIDTTLISEMYQSGCRDIFFGIETGSQELQKVINKNLSLSKVDEIVNFCVDNGYTHTISFILGFPFETPVQLDSTLQLIYKYYKSHYTKISTGILTPEVGTKIAIDYHEKICFDKAYMERNYDYVPLEKEREIVLINDHPGLFSHFYFIENPYFSIHGLRFIEKALRFLCVNYYLTLGVALLKNGSIIDVIADIIGQSLYSLNAVDFQHHLETFETNLQRYTNMSDILKDVFEYEYTIKIMKGNASKVGKDCRILTLRRPYPSLNASEIVTVSPGQYNYIVCAAMDDKHAHKVRLKINYVE